jgi:hypothetical protein
MKEENEKVRGWEREREREIRLRSNLLKLVMMKLRGTQEHCCWGSKCFFLL